MSTRMKFLPIPFALIFIATISSSAQTLPPNFVQELVTAGIENPVAMAFAPDGRIFITEQGGKVRIVKNNTLLAEPFVFVDAGFEYERGLIGIAIDPDFVNNQYVYLYYTVKSIPAHNRISRFTANGDVAVEGSETIILELEDLNTAGLHNGGAMHFGPDGKLYVSVGDGVDANTSQDFDSYNGKILRINPDGTVPEGNPFADGSEKKKKIWAYGLRNPFTFSIQPESGRIFVNDVGQNSWEEINDASEPGKNFGWPMVEGIGSDLTFTNPLFTYSHSGEGSGCAIVGGDFFNPATTNYPPQYYGKYFFMDLCTGRISYLDFLAEEKTVETFSSGYPISLWLSVGPDGNIYFFDRNGGKLYRIIYSATTVPVVINHPTSAIIPIGNQIQLNVTAIGTQPLSYQWQRDEQNIEGAVSSQYLVDYASFSHSGRYRVIVSNDESRDTSNIAQINVVANPPIVEIIKPASDSIYIAGTDIEFSGIASDVEDGELHGADFKWNINFHHNTHKHDQPPIYGIKNGTFHIPNEGETSDNVWYRIILTVTDSDGLQGKDSIDLYPLKTTINLSTYPEGLPLILDGQPINTPASIVSVVGLVRTINASASLIAFGGTSFNFEAWTNGGSIDQSFPTPQNDTTLIARFGSVEPFIMHNPQDTTVKEGQAFTLSVSTLSPEQRYQWQKNGIDVEGATAELFLVEDALPFQSGDYRVIVKNENGSDTSYLAKVTVIPNTPPTAEIIDPIPNSLYTAGTNIEFSGIGTDLEDEVLAENSYSWNIRFYRDEEILTESVLIGKNNSFYVSNRGETSDKVWYRLILTVKDSRGLQATDSVDLKPRISKINLYTNPEGLQLILDGEQIFTPITVNSVQGLLRTIEAMSPQIVSNSILFEFDSWSHDSDPIQKFVTPSRDTTFTALFNVVEKTSSVFPNPVVENLATLVIPTLKAQNVSIDIVDVLSRKKMSFQKSLLEGRNYISLDLSELADGIYSVGIELDDEFVVFKMMIAR